MQEPRATLILRVPQSLRAAVERRAEESDLTMTQVIRHLLTREFSKERVELRAANSTR